MAWYNASWTKRIKITVDNAKVGGADQTGFPVYVDLSNLPAGFHTNVNQTDARDIRVTTSDEVSEVPREVVFYTAASDTGELYFKGTLDTDADTDFYIYYGNAAATEPAADSAYGKNNVWSSFSNIYHLQNLTDSKGGNDFVNDTTETNEAVKIGKGFTFDDHAAHMDFTSNIVMNGNWSLEWWSQTTGTGNNVLFNKHDINTAYILFNGATLSFYRDGDASVYNWTIDDGALNHWVLTNAGTGNTLLYKNGTVDANTGTAGTNNVTIGQFGRSVDGSNSFIGHFDEVRFSATTFTASWVTTSYNNQSSPSTFYIVGDEESGGGGSAVPEGQFLSLKRYW